ncbi:unnamed protein product [Brassicogethes aeneus]|uniref:Rab3 GTPase-activating protein catalytic subunit n=1 Tax=Brassicogethes aeneus TaxID=1431903 RepID=A0A9P0BAL6_BRAAE|nr:unnamed protein product [Brassicogethes aeneus]
MNEEIDDSEFYTQDFTTASEWEIFIARMEEIINQWKTDEVIIEENKSIWSVRQENIIFADFDFTFYWYKKKDVEEVSESSDSDSRSRNPVSGNFDFEMFSEADLTNESCISTWYGLDEFMVLTPTRNVGINSESRIKILLSSVYIVSSNVNNDIPIFVQIRDKWQKCFMGVFEGNGVRTNFEMVHLRRGPQHCQYLTGLLDLFKTKIMSPCSMDPIMCSVQLTYVLSDFGNFIWKQDSNNSEIIDMENVRLPFGVTVEPIKSIILKSTWKQLPEHLVVDSESYTDFDPHRAPIWSILAQMTKEPLCLLGDGLTEVYQLLSNHSNVYDSLGDYANNTTTPETNNPLDLLTEPAVPTISTLLNKAARSTINKHHKGVPPISENVLVPLLYFLFPDADESSTYPYGRDSNNEKDSPTKNKFINLEQDSKSFKTCPQDSLIWRLSIVLTHALQSLGGVKAFAHIWYEFVQEMRYRWEKSMPIPGLPSGFPDLRTCLLNQKLQMLNCCIERKIARETHRASQHFVDAENSSEDDDEFYECSEDGDSNKKYSMWNQPVGRLGKFNELKLLKTGDPLYIPVTQEPVLKTEDQLEEDTEVLLNLGDDNEASEVRARIMSASLLSDMESFKAANPGAIVEDFIRWYSPNDWIIDEENEDGGYLSPRMNIQNNIWVQMWETAKPVPAHRQKRLFDDTREAEKILQFLDYRNLSQICELIVPVLAHGALYRLVDEYNGITVNILQATARVTAMTKQVERISRDVKFQPRRFDAFIQDVSNFELTLSQINSLGYKFNPSGSFDNEINEKIGDLVIGKEIELLEKSNSNIGSRVLSMFSDAQNTANMISGETNEKLINPLPTPFQREFVMRVAAVKPASCSARCPQFLRAILSKNEFRLCGAFSEDIVFF